MEDELDEGQQPYAADRHMGMERFRGRGETDVAERTLRAAWVELNTKGGSTCNTLDGILGEPSSERDAMVAGTVIQWLGTSVGMSWLRETFRAAGGEIVYPPTSTQHGAAAGR